MFFFFLDIVKEACQALRNVWHSSDEIRPISGIMRKVISPQRGGWGFHQISQPFPVTYAAMHSRQAPLACLPTLCPKSLVVITDNQILGDPGHLWALNTFSFWNITINSSFLFFMAQLLLKSWSGFKQRRMTGGKAAEEWKVCSLVASVPLNWSWDEQSHWSRSLGGMTVSLCGGTGHTKVVWGDCGLAGLPSAHFLASVLQTVVLGDQLAPSPCSSVAY